MNSKNSIKCFVRLKLIYISWNVMKESFTRNNLYNPGTVKSVNFVA